jgi:UDP-glucose 4-epimerase
VLRSSKEAGVKRVIFSSSSSVYGGSHILPTPEDAVLNPKSPYALHKKIGEEYCKIYSHMHNVETISLRYFNVFGPRQRYDSAYAAVIPSFCKSIVDGIKPIVYGDGMQFRDFTYVENIVNANILAAETKNKLNGEAVNIGCGEQINLLTIIKKLGCLEPSFERERLGDVRCSQADIALANKIINYDPAIKVDDGLKKTLDWYLKNKNIL